MDLGAVMDEMATKLDTIAGLRISAFPADQVSVPAAVVGWPETLSFDTTMGRGVDMLTFPVFVLVGKTWDRTTRDLLSGYCDGTGAGSVKVALQAKPNTAYASLRVTSAEFNVVTVAGVDYMAAVFSVDVYGTGA